MHHWPPINHKINTLILVKKLVYIVKLLLAQSHCQIPETRSSGSKQPKMAAKKLSNKKNSTGKLIVHSKIPEKKRFFFIKSEYLATLLIA